MGGLDSLPDNRDSMLMEYNVVELLELNFSSSDLNTSLISSIVILSWPELCLIWS